MAFPLYETPNTNAHYTDEPDMRLLGTVTLSLPPGWASKISGTTYDLEVSLRFTACTAVPRCSPCFRFPWPKGRGKLSCVPFATRA